MLNPTLLNLSNLFALIPYTDKPKISLGRDKRLHKEIFLAQSAIQTKQAVQQRKLCWQGSLWEALFIVQLPKLRLLDNLQCFMMLLDPLFIIPRALWLLWTHFETSWNFLRLPGISWLFSVRTFQSWKLQYTAWHGLLYLHWCSVPCFKTVNLS